ncbi:tyrosine-type recombinase/integrase [Comamonas sp. GB3 AK4-5]|uniref:tyrosine-type recombinase/integrase n=1 Tax=Comamonas sp. GB3 AK4-5 TaxID=3231487 RepID=UPI00351E5BCD
MHLFYTDKSFELNGVSLPGIPFLANADAELIESANRYLFHIAVVRGRTRAPATWRTYANHLYEFFSFLEENTLFWSQVNQEHIAVWRNSMLDRDLSRSTINKRLSTTCAFYTWCARQGLTEQRPFETQEVLVSKSKGFLVHVDATGSRVQANELTLRTQPQLPKFLSIPEALQFIETLSPRRTQLLAYLMLLCGLRREEACALDVRVLPTPAGHSSGKAIKMTLDPCLTPTKGSKERWVMVPYDLVGHLFDYMMRVRPKLVSMHRKRHGKETTKLFLTRDGAELSLDGLDVSFQRASTKSGVKCTPHRLRHTFGTYEFLRVSEKWGTDSALHWVRDRLGHSSIATTEVYVHAADLLKHDEVDGYVEEVLQLVARPS